MATEDNKAIEALKEKIDAMQAEIDSMKAAKAKERGRGCEEGCRGKGGRREGCCRGSQESS